MIKVENIDVWGFEHAIKNMKAKGYRRTKTGFETFVSNHSKKISLGTYKTEEEARNIVLQYRINRFISGCQKYNINPKDGIEYESNYIIFPSGIILNLHGEEIKGGIDRNGYRGVIINGKQKLVHRIIAETFIKNPNNLPQVNHKDGIKTNNNVSNLEWCTRSDNLKHAYEKGLEKASYGENHCRHKLTSDIIQYIRSNFIKGNRKYGAAALGRKFGVDKSTIEDAYYKRTWRHIK